MSADPRPALYLGEWVASPGDTVRVMASGAGQARASLVRLHGLVGTTVPTGYAEEMVGQLDAINLRDQPVPLGSFAATDHGPSVSAGAGWRWTVRLCPTLVDAGTVLCWGNDGPRLLLRAGLMEMRWQGAQAALPVAANHWIELELAFAPSSGLSFKVTPLGSGSWYRSAASLEIATPGRAVAGPLSFGKGYNGRIENPALDVDGQPAARWEFSDAMNFQHVPGRGSQARPLVLINAPRRATKSSAWSGEAHDWTRRPDHYAAIHFHDDDLADCLWTTDIEFKLPDDADSGIYAVRVEGAAGVRHTPLFVRPNHRKRVAFLASTLSYLAYGNSVWNGRLGTPWEIEHADEVALARRFGRSVYCRHRDGSGIGLVSTRRPILSFTPGIFGEAIGGQVLLNDDLRILHWLRRVGEPFDVVTDHDLHERGEEVLDGYDVLITGTHPEYHSFETLDAIECFTGRGGRLMYMGANGFYWRVATLPDAPHVMELRRAEGGIRTWAEPPSEYVHQSDGRLGGLWRRLGRPPNRLVGVGYSAQGLEQDTRPYELTEAATNSRAAFLLDGVEGPLIGKAGPLGAAAAYELDRADTSLGTPPHALVVARSTPFDGEVSPVNEERLTDRLVDADDPLRSDIVFFEGPRGGAVLALGSILFAGALDEADGAGRLVTNALKRFVDPAPFDLPSSGPLRSDHLGQP